MSRVPIKALGTVVVLGLLAVALFVSTGGGADPKTVTAHFPRAVSIFPGTDVRILGVNVGSVSSVTPEGDSVRVEMEYDAEYDLPAGAQAVIVTPTLVADRFVQLTPVFTEGEVMADGADIPLAETAVPVELDRIYASLRDLTETLGPNGVNADGTLNNLLRAGADALDGQGARTNAMIRNLAAAADTFGAGAGDLFTTVSQLAEFTATLADNDRLVRAFLADLAGVSEQLAGERTELEGVLSAVADTVGTVQGFVRDNREALATDVRKLTRVIGTINSEKDSLNTALDVAPVAMGNLVLAFNTESGSIGSRIGLTGNVQDADGLLCAIVQQSALPKITKTLACQIFEMVLEPLVSQAPSVPPESPGRRTSGFQAPPNLTELLGGRS